VEIKIQITVKQQGLLKLYSITGKQPYKKATERVVSQRHINGHCVS